MSEVEHLLGSQNRVGEGPVWDAAEQALYWVDIEQNVFHRLYLSGEKAGESQTFGAGVMVGALALRQAADAPGGKKLPEENYYGWLVNDRLSELRGLLRQ